MAEIYTIRWINEHVIKINVEGSIGSKNAEGSTREDKIYKAGKHHRKANIVSKENKQ